MGRELLRCSGMPPGASSSNKRFHLNFSARRPDLAALDDGIEIWGSRCQQKAMEGWKLTGPYLSRVRLVSRPTARWLPLLRSAGWITSIRDLSHIQDLEISFIYSTANHWHRGRIPGSFSDDRLGWLPGGQDTKKKR